MFKVDENLNKEFKIIVSPNKNYHNYCIISSYDNLKDAENNMNKDISNYRMKNHNWWRVVCPVHHAVIREKRTVI